MRDPSRPVIILDNFPPYASTDDTMVSIANRAQEYAWKTRHPELAAQSGLPIKDLIDLTARGDYWFACLPVNGTPAEVLRDQLLKVHEVTIYVSVGLAPATASHDQDLDPHPSARKPARQPDNTGERPGISPAKTLTSV